LQNLEIHDLPSSTPAKSGDASSSDTMASINRSSALPRSLAA
jgi:hypothetical protein